jgi:hypothetical protein
MSRCKGCGKEYRKGVRAFLLTADGLVGALVCPGCARAGVLLVAVRVAPVVKKVAPRADGVDRAVRQLRVLAKAARATGDATAVGDSSSYFTGRAEGFEGAIEYIKREILS